MSSPPFNSITHAVAVLRRAGLVHRSRDGYVALYPYRDRTDFTQAAIMYLDCIQQCRQDLNGEYPFGTIPYDA